MASFKATLCFVFLVIVLVVNGKASKKAPCCDQYPDTEIVNNNLADTVGQLNECCGLCASIPGCAGWTWDNSEGGTCWFKSASGPGIVKTGSITGNFCQNRRN